MFNSRLAIKSFYYHLLDDGDITLSPTTVPHYTLPVIDRQKYSRKVTAAQCPLHSSPPNPNCTCGINVSLDPKVVWNTYTAPSELRMVVGSVQVMGTALRDGFDLRVSRYILYSLLMPKEIDGCGEEEFISRLHRNYRPVINRGMLDFYLRVLETWPKGAFE